MRTKNQPKKWPIPDTVGEPVYLSSQHPLAMHPLGPPVIPIPTVVPCSNLNRIPNFPQPVVAPPPLPFSVHENLNPEVPEFVPVDSGKEEGNIFIINFYDCVGLLEPSIFKRTIQ